MDQTTSNDLSNLVSQLNTLEDRIRLLQNRATTLRAEFAAALVDESPDGQDLLGSAIDEIMAREYSGPHVVPMPHSPSMVSK